MDPLLIIAGIKEFGLAPDGSDLRDLSAAIERLTKERDEHLRLKNELVLKAYSAMDERDRLYTELAKAREELTFFRPAIEHIAKLNGTYVHVAINAVTTAAVALKAVKDAAALAPEGKPVKTEAGLRHDCAASGLHDHDGCDCSAEELARRAALAPEGK